MNKQMQEIRSSLNTCCLCNNENNNLTCISDNYIKFEDLYIPYCEILQETLGFEIKCNEKLPSREVCKRCEKKVFDFYNFKRKCKKIVLDDHLNPEKPYKASPLKISDKLVHSTVQLIQEFVKKNGGIEDIKEVENQLIISSVKLNHLAAGEVSSTTFHDALSIKQEPLVEVKEEPVEIKIELNEDNEADIADILGLNLHEEELTNSSDSSHSRLPAFCANRFFDGNRFVSRAEYLESKLKGQQKKRERRPEFWAAAVQKKLRSHGQQYRSVKGNIVPARKLGLPCNCRKNCGTKISENNRLTNFKNYWELENASEKRKFIIDHVKLLRPKRALTKTRIFSRIMHHFLDVVNYDGSTEQIKVCKKMFCSTLAISNTVVSNAFKLNNKEQERFFEK